MSGVELKDVTSWMNRLDKKVYELDQRMFSSTGGGSNVFKTIIIDDGSGGPPIIIGIVADPPTGLNAIPGALFDKIYIDVSWTSIPGHTYQVEWAKKNIATGVYTLVSAAGGLGGNSYRINNLEPMTHYGVRVYTATPAGIYSAATDWFDVDTSKDATIPPAVTNVLIARGATTVIVKFDPLTIAQAADVAQGKGVYRIQISNDNFATVYAETMSTSWVVPFNDITAEGSWKARVTAIDSSGNESAPATSTPYTAGGVIDSMLVGDFSAAHITFGTMSGDRITANTLDVAAIKSSSITTNTITLAGGTLRALGSGGGVGMAINSQGISFYNTGGTRTIFFDASSGAGSFTGTIVATAGTLGDLAIVGTLTGGEIVGATITGGIVRTAASGARIEMHSSSSRFIDFWPTGAEYQPGHLYCDVNGAERRVFLDSPLNFSTDARAQLYLVSDVDSIAIVEATNLYLRGPGSLQAQNITYRAYYHWFEGNLATDFAMNDHFLYIRARSDGLYRINYTPSEGSPANGTQTINGVVIYGAEGVGIGGANAYGLGFRVYCDGTTFRNDSYNMLYCLGGLQVTGTKSFAIDHPVKGPDYYLMYSSIEGPKADVVYRGRVTLDANGEATVDIDKWTGQTKGTFKALTLDDTIQFFLFNESHHHNPSATFVDSELRITGTPKHVVGWQVWAERGDDDMKSAPDTDSRGSLINERKKTPLEKETTKKVKRSKPRASKRKPINPPTPRRSTRGSVSG